jgi:hypothetical protein
VKRRNVIWLAGLALAAIAIVSFPTRSQAGTQPAVARISLIQGDVTTMRGDSGQWTATTINTPVMPGDQIATGAGSRAEVQLDYADVVRLDQNTVVKVADLTRSRIQLQVARGRVDYVVLQGAQSTSEVDTPNVAIQPDRPGTYRVDVNSQDQSRLTVRRGEAQASTPQGSTTVREGQLITIQGTNNPEYHIADAPARDGWDSWNRRRNRSIEDAKSWRYTNHYYTGAENLDANGHWVYVPGYGWCWTPYENAGWAPYRMGRWVWEPYYGWTWVSYESWGWAPYHYGRWMFWDDDWVWWPGYVTPVYYPVWAPAYVSFFGFGYGRFQFGFGLGYGFNSIGWCPLGPADPFYPWWGGGRSFNVVNITNITNITNVNQFNYARTQRIIGVNGRTFYSSNLRGMMVDPRMRGGVTMVSAHEFGRGYVPHHLQPVHFTALRQADIVRGTLPVVPSRASLSPVNRRPVVPAVARSVGNTRFFTRHPAPAMGRSFNTEAAGIRQMVQTRRALTPTNFASGRNAAASARMNVQANGAQMNRARRSGSAGTRVNSNAAFAARTSGSSGQAGRPGWHTFGAPQARTSAANAHSFAFGGQARPSPARTFSRQAAPARGWQRFGAQAQPAQRMAARNQAAPSRFMSRPMQPSNNRPSGNPGWRRFTPQSQAAPRSYGSPRYSQPRTSRSGWNGFTPHAAPAPAFHGGGYSGRTVSRGGYYGGRPSYSAPRSYSRPPLELNRSLMAPRNYGGGRPSYGGSRSSGGYSRGGAVFHGGGRSAPSPRSFSGRGRTPNRH